MKKLAFAFISILLFCLVFYNNAVIPDYFYVNNTDDHAISSIEKQEFDSGKKCNNTFFNLMFGMSRQEVEKEFMCLNKENIINQVSSHCGILGANYHMEYHEYSNYGRVYCFFHENKLTELQIDTINTGGNLLDLFLKKYGEADFMVNQYGNNEFHWISGNNHLTIIQPEASKKLLIQYVDLSEKFKENNENLLKKWGLLPKA